MKKLSLLIFCILFTTFAKADDSLTIFVYPPHHKLNWHSPRSAITSFLGIEIEKVLIKGHEVESIDDWGEKTAISSQYRSTMGHTITHINCQLNDGSNYDEWVSFSGQDFQEVDKDNVFKKKLGLGILFYDYLDGHLITGEENVKRIIYYKGIKHRFPQYLKFSIRNDECENLKKMVDFFKTFHWDHLTTKLTDLEAKAPQDVLYFTTNIDPYESYHARMLDPKAIVGGGCAPFAISLLKEAGLYSNELDRLFKMNLNIATDSIGNENHPVNLSSIIIGKRSSHWAKDGEPTRLMSQYDPQLIWNFVNDLKSCETGSECNLNSLNWFQHNKIIIGQDIILKDNDNNQSRTVEGIIVE